MLCISPHSAVMLSDGRSVSLEEGLGQGSAGVVYRGVIESGWGVRRPVAVKLLAIEDMDEDEAMRTLARIAQRSAAIRHPSVIQLLEVDVTDAAHGNGAMPFLVMELVEGESLASILSGWKTSGIRVPVDFATVVTMRTAEALGEALFTDRPEGSLTHLVHGDLSPRQILISNQGDVKVGDFGLGGFVHLGSKVRSRSRMAYTAPEIVAGGAISPRSDVFSLGVILHEMLIGPRFAPGMDHGDALRMVQGGNLHSSALEPNLPRSLRDVIEKATQRNPRDRYQHARSMAFDLRREMHRLGLTDAQTSIRHAVVGYCEVKAETRESYVSIDLSEMAAMMPPGPIPEPRKSDIVPRAERSAIADPEDTDPDMPFAIRSRAL